MDAEHFDAITRRAATTSRRHVLGGLLASVLVGLGVLRAPHSALADPDDFNKRGQSCDLSLDPLGSDCNSPCRTCRATNPDPAVGRCVYKCRRDEVCVASANECV
jgi:hypothetical protein